jgi:alkylated DNA repair protein (DNA oxidative demethylase)
MIKQNRKMRNIDLFENVEATLSKESLAIDAMVLRGWAIAHASTLVDMIQDIAKISPFRTMQTPGGLSFSVATSSCGPRGWISDRQGYRYVTIDPLTNKPWPKMPKLFLDFASHAATSSGFDDFVPDSCLINRYEPGAKLSLHQDKDEKALDSPIVSVSLGLPATFLFGGLKRTDKVKRILLQHGDVVVWGGKSRMAFHGVMPIKHGNHPLTGKFRINLTFRKSG